MSGRFRVGMIAATLLLSLSVSAQEAQHDWAIPAGPLANTLREIERVSGQTIRFESRDVQDVQVPALTGARSAVSAVQAALAGSGLQLTRRANGDLAVFVLTLGQVAVTASRGEAETGFKVSSSETATRSGVDLRDVPQTVSVVTAKVLETRQDTNVQQALSHVPGVVVREQASGVPSYSVRGFSQSGALVNGVNTGLGALGLNTAAASAIDVAGVDRIEVLKGPSSILSGGDSLGGSVNIVTKKPTVERTRAITLQYGSHADKRASVDFGGALDERKRLSWRVIGSVARASSANGGFDGRESNYALAQLRWKDDATDFLAGVSYTDQYSPQSHYTFARTGAIQPLPSIRLGRANAGAKIENRTAFYSLEHAFSRSVTLVSRLQYSDASLDLNTWNVRFPASTTRFAFGNTSDKNNSTTTSGDHYLRLRFNTGPVEHKVSTGLNHTHLKGDLTGWNGPGAPWFVEVYEPGYEFPAWTRDDTTLAARNSFKGQQLGLFAQDLIRWGDWNLLLGVRKNRYSSGPSTAYSRLFGFETTTVHDKRTEETTSVNAGLVYNLSWNTSLFASWSEGFYPQFVTAKVCNDGRFLPMETENKELGIKGGSLDDGFSWSAAAFQLDQTNVGEYNQSGACYDFRKAQRLRGLELEAAGKLLPGLNLTANYTYTSTKDSGDTSNLPSAQPRHQANVWATYDFHSEPLSGLGVALGLDAWSKSRLGNTPNDPSVPGALRVDAGVSYAKQDWSLRLGVKNLFDRDLYGHAATTLFVPVLDGRTYTLTFNKRF